MDDYNEVHDLFPDVRCDWIWQKLFTDGKCRTIQYITENHESVTKTEEAEDGRKITMLSKTLVEVSAAKQLIELGESQEVLTHLNTATETLLQLLKSVCGENQPATKRKREETQDVPTTTQELYSENVENVTDAENSNQPNGDGFIILSGDADKEFKDALMNTIKRIITVYPNKKEDEVLQALSNNTEDEVLAVFAVEKEILAEDVIANDVDELLEEEIKYECPICGEENAAEDCIECQSLDMYELYPGQPEEIRHKFCAECTTNYIGPACEEMKIARGGAGLICMEYNCTGFIPGGVLRALCTENAEVLNRLEKCLETVALQQFKVEYCKNCSNGMVVEGSQEQIPFFSCSECNASYCRKCRYDQEEHLGKSCEDVMTPEDRQRIELEESLTNVMIHRCNNCKVAFEKTDGCNHVRCTKCGTSQCYYCRKNLDASHNSLNGMCGSDPTSKDLARRTEVLRASQLKEDIVKKLA